MLFQHVIETRWVPNQYIVLYYHQPASKMPFKWHFARAYGGPHLDVYWDICSIIIHSPTWKLKMTIFRQFSEKYYYTIIWKCLLYGNIWKCPLHGNILEMPIVWKYLEMPIAWKHLEMPSAWKHLECPLHGNTWKCLLHGNIWEMFIVWKPLEMLIIWKCPLYRNICKCPLH